MIRELIIEIRNVFRDSMERLKKMLKLPTPLCVISFIVMIPAITLIIIFMVGYSLYNKKYLDRFDQEDEA